MVILLGCYWLLDSLNMISPGIMSMPVGILPYLFILLGMLLIIVPLVHRKRPGFFWGLFFLIYGGLILAGDWGKVSFQWQDFWKLWPYLIIYFGLTLLFEGPGMMVNRKRKNKNKKRRVNVILDDDEEKPFGEDRPGTSFKFIHDASYKEENWTVRPINERVKIVNYNFDFTKAFIPEETIPITLSGWVGDIKITIPDDVPFRVSVKATVGDVRIAGEEHSGILKNIDYQTINYDQTVRKIDFKFDFQVIDLTISQV